MNRLKRVENLLSLTTTFNIIAVLASCRSFTPSSRLLRRQNGVLVGDGGERVKNDDSARRRLFTGNLVQDVRGVGKWVVGCRRGTEHVIVVVDIVVVVDSGSVDKSRTVIVVLSNINITMSYSGLVVSV